MTVQADQTLCKVLKYLKFRCSDVSSGWNAPETVVVYCLRSLNMLSDFIDYLQHEWKIGYSGIIGYMNALGHLLDFRRKFSHSASENVSVFLPSEIYLQRVKRFLSKKTKLQWNEVLSVDYLNSINCWATLAHLQKVIPFHANRYKKIILNSTTPSSCIASHDLSFATSFIVAVLFLMVKASRPMTYKHLTVEMIKSIGENGIINQTLFKTNEKYGFDSHLSSVDVLTLVTGYANYKRPHINPACNYLLLCRNRKQISKLTNTSGRIVYEAIRKYINPTRYRQIIETESIEKLDTTEQANLSQDQKHTSTVAKRHYQKGKSEDIAAQAKNIMDKLRDKSESSVLNLINSDTESNASNNASLGSNGSTKVGTFSVDNIRMKKVPFSEMKDSFLKQGVLKYGMRKCTSILSDSNYKFHSFQKASTLAVREKRLYK